jgi:hypothetical protein
MTTAYLVASICTFAAVAVLHAVSYSRDLPQGAFYITSLVTLILCLPLVALFVRVKKGVRQEEAWPRFWDGALRYCPRWIWGSMTVAWFLAMLSFARTFLGHEFTPVSFQTAWFLMPAGAALSYAVTLARTPKTPNQSLQPTAASRRG